MVVKWDQSQEEDMNMGCRALLLVKWRKHIEQGRSPTDFHESELPVWEFYCLTQGHCRSIAVQSNYFLRNWITYNVNAKTQIDNQHWDFPYVTDICVERQQVNIRRLCLFQLLAWRFVGLCNWCKSLTCWQNNVQIIKVQCLKIIMGNKKSTYYCDFNLV